jgi:hypothetical protein
MKPPNWKMYQIVRPSSATDLLPLAVAGRIAHARLTALRGAERRDDGRF